MMYFCLKYKNYIHLIKLKISTFKMEVKVHTNNFIINLEGILFIFDFITCIQIKIANHKSELVMNNLINKKYSSCAILIERD